MDVIAINRYYSWYSDSGHPEVVYPQLSTDLNNWYATHAKPMMLTEYGAGTVAGLHEVRGTLGTVQDIGSSLALEGRPGANEFFFYSTQDPPMPFTEDYQVCVSVCLSVCVSVCLCLCLCVWNRIM